MGLGENLKEVRTAVEVAARKAGRNPSEITLVGVSKTATREAVEQAFLSGLRDFGENRIPDAEEKFAPLPFPQDQAVLHLIGHLQSNKAVRAVKLFHTVHSVDSLKLAEILDNASDAHGKKLTVLLQVNVSGEQSKAGIDPQNLGYLLEQVLELKHIEVRGLMTIAPNFEDPEKTRPVFAGLRQLFEKYNPGTSGWRELSMGMTNDYRVAIEEGSTMVRVGRAIFSA